MKKNIFFFLLNLNLILNFASCNTTEPPNNQTLKLELKDVSCTEAWLQLTSANIQIPNNISLLINGNVKKTFTLNTQDSLLYIDSLLPNQTYKLQVSGIQNPVSSNELTITTMDTTSHNFTWQTFTFGQHSSSTLYDVAIINENDIWAVGEIYMNDSQGNPDPTKYNAIHWNGVEWELKRVQTLFNGNLITVALEGIFAFSSTDIWMVGSLPIHGDGTNWTMYDVRTTVDPNLSLSKVWGAGSNDLYFVGRNGSIAHYHNGSWTKIESGTTLGLSDVLGNETSAIYACGGNLNTGQGIILKINSNHTVSKIIDSYYYGTGFDSTKMFKENLYGPLVGIWVAENGNIYTVGNLIYRFNKAKWDYAKGIDYNYLGAGEFSGRGFSWDIGGTDNNDFFFVGQRNTIRHFNGINAIQLGEPFSYTSEYSWIAVDHKNNLAVTVGRKGGQAAVIIFKR